MTDWRIVDVDYVPTPGEIDSLLAFLRSFERSDFVPSWARKDGAPGFEDEWAPELTDFNRSVYDNGFISLFDWGDWQSDALLYYNSPELLARADIHTLQRLITLHVRKERFAEGHLPAMIREGHITNILRRLQQLRASGTGPDDLGR